VADQPPTPYELLGGDAVVRALVDRFYALMDATPEYYGIRKLHPESLAGSADKLYMYLSGWLGGPNLYIDRYGHPRLRARHLPYAIAGAERDQWMACMRQAMVDVDVDARLREPLLEALQGVADWMRNRPDGGAG
jgi:hemoglobin